jgi:hypothetical protein
MEEPALSLIPYFPYSAPYEDAASSGVEETAA